MAKMALAQIDPVVGDLEGNAAKIRDFTSRAAGLGAEYVLFPAGALSGAPVGGLLDDADFMAKGEAILERLRSELNRRAILSEPFAPPALPPVGAKLRADAGRYFLGEPGERWAAGIVEAVAGRTWLAAANLVGGQDEYIYAGGSFVVDPAGNISVAARFAEDVLLFDTSAPLPAAAPPPSGDADELYRALVMAVRDYVNKNRLAGIAVAISGGIDSALVASMAVDALGSDKVHAVTLPGPFTSDATFGDAKKLAANLGIDMAEIPISECCRSIETALAPVLAGAGEDPENLTGQNIQARVRGLLLMGLANRRGLLAINSSNKSEGAVGYGTLYGDLVGGFAPLKDVWKTGVWELSRQVNRIAGHERIPASIIDRVPTAELRHGQEDRQSIPDYPVLDALMGDFIDRGKPYSELLRSGHDEAAARKALGLYYRNLFKAKQTPVGPIVTRELVLEPTGNVPFTNRFRPWA